MNIRIEPGAIDYQKTHHAMNVMRSNALLERLIRFHGDGRRIEYKVFLPAIIYPCPFTAGIKKAKRLSAARLAAERAYVEPTITLDDIGRAVCLHFGITRTQLIARRRQKLIVYRRGVAIYLARELTPHSWPKIAQRFGDIDHTSAIHAARRIEEQMLESQSARDDVAAVRQLIEAAQ